MIKRSTFAVFCLFVTCMMLLVNGTVIEYREGATEDNCDCLTTFELKPVCGSDGKSYPNKATLNCANECDKSNLKVLHEGLCQDGYHY